MRKILGLVVVGVLITGQVFAAGTRTFVKSDDHRITSAASTWTPSITGKADIQAVTVHFVTPTDEDIGVFLDSELGATYDTVLATSDSVHLSDFFWYPNDKLIIQKDDNIRIRIGGGSGAEGYTMTIRGEYQ